MKFIASSLTLEAPQSLLQEKIFLPEALNFLFKLRHRRRGQPEIFLSHPGKKNPGSASEEFWLSRRRFWPKKPNRFGL